MDLILPDTGFAPDNTKSIFLAGSIEQGRAEDWQTAVTEELQDCEGTIFSPRRKDWDSTWSNTEEFKPFRDQVEWELEHINKADAVLFYFQPGTKSPISLLEYGLILGNRENQKIWTVCPEGFWRKGNIDITARRYEQTVYDDFVEPLVEIKKFFNK